MMPTDHGGVPDERIVFIGGHDIECHDHHNCDCAERYEDIFGRCSECGETLDKWGECPTPEDHFYA